MKYIRFLLFPFSIVYAAVTSFRNYLFDANVLKSHSFDLPIIAVGNLNVGGTGKTPQIEYLIRLLLKKYSVATLSRGYKRKSKGFLLADASSTFDTLGDEPFQFYKKFDNISVAVDANRKNGIEHLLRLPNKPNVILLDDAFQHRKVKAGLYILLTVFDDLYCNDFVLPAGNLRESRVGANRATIIIVTKCPSTISEKDKTVIRTKLNVNSNQHLFFSKIGYDANVFSANQTKSVSEIKTVEKLLVAGIANPLPFLNFLKNEHDDVLLFPDHHEFSNNDILEINTKAVNKLILTTEKDYVRLQEKLKNENLFYLPIKSTFLENDGEFDNLIFNFVKNYEVVRMPSIST